MKNRRIVQELLLCLHNKEEEIRAISAEVLGEIQDPYCIKQLIKDAIYEQDDEVRWIAKDSLKRMKSDDIVNELINLLNTDDKKIVQYSCKLLKEIRSSAIIPKLIDSLINCKDANLETMIKSILISLKDSDSLLVYIDLLTDRSIIKRRYALEILEAMKWNPSTNKEKASYYYAKENWEELMKFKEEAKPILLQAIKDEIEDIRAWSADCLAHYKDKDVVNILIQTLKDESEVVRSWAIVSLGEIGDEESVKPLEEILDKETRDLKKLIIESLYKISGEKAIKALVRIALTDYEEEIRELAFEFASEIVSSGITEYLIPLLRKSKEYIRINILNKLVELKWKPKDPFEIVIFNIYKGDWKKIEQLKNLAVEPLIDLLDSSNTNIKIQIINMLGKIKDSKAVFPLISVLKDKNCEIRKAAVEALGKIEDERAVFSIIEMIKDDCAEVGYASIIALSYMEHPEAISKLIEISENKKDSEYKKIAEKALKYIREKYEPESLIEIIKGNITELKLWAIQVLTLFEAEKELEQLKELIIESNLDLKSRMLKILGKKT